MNGLLITNIKWLDSARCTSWDINQGCFAFMKPVLYIRCLLGSMHVCINYFAEKFRSSSVVENVFPINFNQLFHDCFIRLCLWLKCDLHFSIPLFSSLPDLSATVCDERLEEVVVHFYLQKWLIGRCTVVFQGLISHWLSQLHQHQSFHRFYRHPWQKETAFGSCYPNP